MGEIEVTVEGMTQMMKDGQTITIEVLPEVSRFWLNVCLSIYMESEP